MARVIRSNGYDVVLQVGVSGFWIDLGVIDPSQPGRFVIGVECDGATYHSARSARDRDRLRHEVLVRLGWRLHRIWSTDWFRNPQREIARLLAAIEHACASAPPLATPALPPSPVAEETPEPAPVGPQVVALELPAYNESRPPVPTHRDLLTLKPFEMAALTAFVVKEEGPIHEEEVARRIREAFGFKGRETGYSARSMRRSEARRGWEKFPRTKGSGPRESRSMRFPAIAATQLSRSVAPTV